MWLIKPSLADQEEAHFWLTSLGIQDMTAA